MSIPDAAIEAAAEAVTAHYDEPAGSCRGIGFCNEIVARAAVEAAMPAIREALGDELSAGFDKDNEAFTAEAFSDDYNDGYVYAMELADRIVRGGTP